METHELEKHLIAQDQWDTAPEYVMNMAQEATHNCISTGIGHHKDTGWFILHRSEQPYIAWCERDDEEEGVVDASSIGIQDGAWPEMLTYNNVIYRKVRDILDPDQELEAVLYQNPKAQSSSIMDENTLVVVNDAVVGQ